MDESDEKNSKSYKKQIKRCFALTEEGATPTNWRVIFIVITALFGSSYSITFLFPFLPDMILYFGYSEEDKGYYVGYVASGMFLGRMVGSFFWGWLSDKYGRRPIILLSLVLTGLTNLAFGFSVNVKMAIAIRVLCGLFNGIVGACKTILYEISDNTNQAVGMSAIALAWGSGIVLGPYISGVLAEPSKRYPSVFPPGQIFDSFPFLLPSLVATAICFIGWIGVWWKMPETLQKNTTEMVIVEGKSDDNLDNGTELMSKAPLQAPNGFLNVIKSKSTGDLASCPTEVCKEKGESHRDSSHNVNIYSSQILRYADSGTVYEDVYDVYGLGKAPPPLNRDLVKGSKSLHSFTGTFLSAESTPFMNGFHVCQETGGDAEAKNFSKPEKVTSHSSGNGKETLAVHRNGNTVMEMVPKEKDEQRCFSLKNFVFCRLLRSKDVNISITLYTLFSFAVIGWEDVFVVWASTETRFGGLAFSPQMIGTALGGSSCVLLFVQVFVYPKLVARFGPLKTMQAYGVYLIFISTCIATYRFLLPEPSVMWTLLLVSMGLQKMAVTSCFSSLSIFLNNSVKPEDAGSVNGIGMTFAAIGRALGPTFCGSLFAWSIKHGVKIGFPLDVNFVFILMGVVYLIINILSSFTPRSLETQKKPNPKQDLAEKSERQV